MRKYFITGLVILLPLAMTLAIVLFIINMFTDPFVGLVSNFLQHYGILQEGLFFLSAEQIQTYASKLIILLLLFFFTVLLGVLTRWVIVHYFIRLGDFVFHRIPFVRSIYKTSQDVIRTIFGTTTKSFKQVVLIPFPNPETYSVGLVTKEEIPGLGKYENKSMVAVFVPTTPNPTSGYLLMYPEDDVVFLDMKVEEALKYIISCGVILTPFNKMDRSKND